MRKNHLTCHREEVARATDVTISVYQRLRWPRAIPLGLALAMTWLPVSADPTSGSVDSTHSAAPSAKSMTTASKQVKDKDGELSADIVGTRKDKMVVGK